MHDCNKCEYYVEHHGVWYCEHHEERELWCTRELEEMEHEHNVEEA